jgi:putative DNA primase/helicase
VTLKAGITADGKEAIDYVPYDAKDPVQKEIMDFFKQLFPADDLREYILTLAAGCLEGSNLEQCFYIMTGGGGNGKSAFVELMTSVLGQYAGSLASTALTRKRPESGAANPDIMAIRNKHFIFMAEPDNNEPLNTSRIKQFTGEDVVEARGLFEDQTKFQITGKIFMLCNNFPPIQTMDRGTTRRMIAVPFESKFVDPNSDEMKVDSGKKIFPRDPFLDIKLKKWRGAFLARLVHIYDNVYLRKGLHPIPLKVRKETDRYRETFDMFGKFPHSTDNTASDIEFIERFESAGGAGIKQSELRALLERKKN